MATAAESTTQAQPTVPAVDTPPELPERIDGGDIDRPHMLEVLANGIGRFLSRVRVKAERDPNGRFSGWRLDDLFPGEPVQPSVLREGDTLLRVNGQSVERPEQLKTIWDSLVTSRELVLTVRRHGKQSEIRYRIVDPAAPDQGAGTASDASAPPAQLPKGPPAASSPAARTSG